MPENLFDAALEERFDEFAPLAARMRPRRLDELAGQTHLVGPAGPLRSLITSDRLSSLVLWGPPGSGKTTLGFIVAAETRSRFVELSAVSAGVKDVREAIEGARESLGATGRRTILFIDEIHRFNKAQQDALLKAVENNWVTLIGATTENPFFEVIGPLLSRSLLFRLDSLSPADIGSIVRTALVDERGLGGGVEFEEAALDHIVERSGGDARFALNSVEVCAALVAAEGAAVVTLGHAEQALQRRRVRYDKGGDTHYDVVSAFIKSMRGSDPDAAIFYLARMLEAGEDPRFIARRMIIFASEDVGNADPGALGVAVAAAHALEFVGLPEASLNLGQAATYLASAPKSNASARALWGAGERLSSAGPGEVPAHLRGSPGKDRGEGYRYPHDYPGAWVNQQYLPDHVAGARFYDPTDRGEEAAIRARLEKLRREE